MRTQLLRLHIAFVNTRERIRSEQGASLVEYAMLASFIALFCIAAVTYLGGETGGSLDNSQQSIISAN